MKEVDLLIIGQGIAGVNLSYIAKKRGLSCMHVHKSSVGESTHVAAGLVNPITGRRFVKSWNIDEIFPYAVNHYKDLEDEFNESFIDRINILRTFKTVAEENAWLAKSADPFLSEFLLEKLVFDKEVFAQKLYLSELMGELSNCLRIKLSSIQSNYLNHLRENGELIDDWFDLEQLEISENYSIYKDVKAKYVVFAEGWRSIYNPFWKDLPFVPSKGELFIVHSPELQLNSAFKNSMFVTPMGDDLYWVGATYEWKNYDPEIGDKMKPKLLTHVENSIKAPYTIQAHLTGIRPSTKDRRPIIGPHHTKKNLLVFNGMGTKGSSLSPYYAHKLIDFIKDEKPLPDEVSTARYYKK